MSGKNKIGRVRGRALAATAFSALIMGSGAALDSSAARANVAASQNYEIPAGPVALALNRLADKSGAQLVYDAALTRKIKTAGATMGASQEQLFAHRQMGLQRLPCLIRQPE
jgi:hypothetical protein